MLPIEADCGSMSEPEDEARSIFLSRHACEGVRPWSLDARSYSTTAILVSDALDRNCICGIGHERERRTTEEKQNRGRVRLLKRKRK